jgi:translation initiation factor IF-2
VPIRIYALAKELKIDSKELVDICSKAGVTGKGSALASLTDEELVRVKAYLAGDKTKVASSSAAVATMSAANAGQTAFSREDYIGPTGMGIKPRAIVSKPPKPVVEVVEEKAEPAPPERVAKSPQKKEKETVVRVAAIPRSSEQAPVAKAEEPAPQKPIMTLPADAIRNAKTGRMAPLQQFTKQTERKREGERGDKKHGPKFEPAVEPATSPIARDRRKAKPATPGQELEEERESKLAALSNSRAARQQKRRLSHAVQPSEEEEGEQRRPHQRKRLIRKGGTNTAAPRKGKVTVWLPCTVRSLSESTGVPTVSIQRALMSLGSMATINAELDVEMAELLATELELDVEFRQPESLEDKLMSQVDGVEDLPEMLQPRPPIVTFLGHVDHGKTSLLDRIIGTDVVSGEAGGITQHIRAYKISKDGREIAFVDTPGHEAFTEMRARGANVTDIAVLVVAADDGVMPQTEEAISHAKAAGVPIVVAMNKIDLPGADVNHVYQGLAQHELLPAEWGGDVEVVKTSAVTGAGIDDLLETVLLTADLHEYKANPDRPATGTCLEAEQEGNRGVVAKIIVKSGTLRVGDIIVCGAAHGRVKAMYDTLDGRKRVTQAGPSTPVNIFGLDVAPEAGDAFHVLDDIATARQIAQRREMQRRSQSLGGRTVRVSFEEFQRRLEEGRLGSRDDVSVLNLILRADVRGSIEAIQKELAKLIHPEVKIQVLQASVGGITSADVTLADASNAVIVGFNVIPDEAARSLAEERGVEIRRYDIIYKVTDDIRALLEGKLKPEERVTELGRALIQRVFTISRLGTVAGCRVLAGTIERGCRIRVNRDGRGIGDYALESLKREKDDAREVREGLECGMKLAGFNDLKEGDVLEAYKIEEVARTL